MEHSGAHSAHEHHWESSWAPMAIAFGAMFLVPITFAAFLIYHMPLLGIVSAGIGVPLVLLGIAKWVHEGATMPSVLPGVAPAGIGVFIIGEILIFLSLFAGYWTMRITSSAEGTVWPPAGTPELDMALPLIMTVILVASSMTYHYGEVQFEHGRKSEFTLWLLVSIGLGGLFLACTAYEYTHLFHAGFTPSTNAFSFAFYSLTGFHGAHVLVGIAAFLVVLFGAMMTKISPMLVKATGIYWHFVDIVWFFVASQVYFW